MDRRTAAKEQFLLSYCARAIDVLERNYVPALETCHRNIDLWEAEQTCDASYVLAWRELLTKPVEHIRSAGLADSDQAAALRANNPFAGLLDRVQTRRLRDAVYRCAEISWST